jgi:hypothetical protein
VSGEEAEAAILGRPDGVEGEHFAHGIAPRQHTNGESRVASDGWPRDHPELLALQFILGHAHTHTRTTAHTHGK